MLTIVSEMARRKDEEARLEREHTFALLVAQGARKDEEARLERERAAALLRFFYSVFPRLWWFAIS